MKKHVQIQSHNMFALLLKLWCPIRKSPAVSSMWPRAVAASQCHRPWSKHTVKLFFINSSNVSLGQKSFDAALINPLVLKLHPVTELDWKLYRKYRPLFQVMCKTSSANRSIAVTSNLWCLLFLCIWKSFNNHYYYYFQVPQCCKAVSVTFVWQL